MTAIRLDMTMSLDGFCVGPDDRRGQEMGRGGFRLFNWLDHRNDPGPNHDVYADSLATGAIISGRRTFELAGRWNGDHHDGVPILVLTHHVDAGDEPPGAAQFYTDVAECAAAARAGAGDKDVMVHGAGAGQALIRAGELEEIEVHLVVGRWHRAGLGRAELAPVKATLWTHLETKHGNSRTLADAHDGRMGRRRPRWLCRTKGPL